MYRVSWLRAKARRDRWEEECDLLEAEMGWTLNYFKFQQDRWEKYAVEGVEHARSYGYRQREIWQYLYNHAAIEYDACMDAISKDDIRSDSDVSMESRNGRSDGGRRDNSDGLDSDYLLGSD